MFEHRIAPALATTLAIATIGIAAPAAGARLPDDALRAPAAPPSTQVVADTPTPTVTRTIDEGFDWGSAAIGAGGAGIVLLLGAAGLTAANHRRPTMPAAH